MAKKAGIILIKVGGKTLQAMAGVKAGLGGMTRTEVLANGAVIGFFETPVGSNIQCTLPYDANTNIEEIQGWTDVTIVIDPDSGGSLQVNHAFTKNALEIADGGGGFAVEFGGPAAKPV
jgi:hypothetical protein